MDLHINPFRADCTDKEAAVKVLEEAAEVFGAWQTYKPYDKEPTCSADLDGQSAFFWAKRKKILRIMLANELADCITACANLADRYEIDLQAALDRVEKHNRERGRYA